MKKKPEKMTLYICPHCKTLLTILEKRHVNYTQAELLKDGWYTEDRKGSDCLDAYVCFDCGTMHQIDSPISPEGLQPLVLPINIAEEILKLWKDEGNMIGIPLDNPSLKELLTEYLL